MASVASQLIEEVTAHAQSDILEDVREICADGAYFPNNLRVLLKLFLYSLERSNVYGNSYFAGLGLLLLLKPDRAQSILVCGSSDSMYFVWNISFGVFVSKCILII